MVCTIFFPAVEVKVSGDFVFTLVFWHLLEGFCLCILDHGDVFPLDTKL